MSLLKNVAWYRKHGRGLKGVTETINIASFEWAPTKWYFMGLKKHKQKTLFCKFLQILWYVVRLQAEKIKFQHETHTGVKALWQKMDLSNDPILMTEEEFCKTELTVSD